MTGPYISKNPNSSASQRVIDLNQRSPLHDSTHTQKLIQKENRQSFILLKKSFLAINTKRLLRMRDALASRHRQVLDALPMLLHCNHPMMPGFVSRHTPHKVSNFKPTRNDHLIIKSIARSFTYRPDTTTPVSIVGMFIMGSVGTIAQSEKSDLDIWLCYEPNLSRKAINELEKKAQGISEWAAQSQLEIHFFLMNADAFREGQLSILDEESSGSAQHQLLLDEFYRSAIYLCGKTPLWWLISNDTESSYEDSAHQLIRNRHVQDYETIDFGDVANIPAQEFIGAGIWQLYKAIDSPYKSVLKLLLLEAYVSEYPKIEPLAKTFKNLVHEGCSDINELDSYMLVYRRIEKYLLSNNQIKRLELVRRCFYLKINKPLSKPVKDKDKSWQRILLEQLVLDWSWTPKHIKFMDEHHEWKSPQVIEERSMLVTELTRSYRMLLDFSNHVKAGRTISTDELIILGRKLNATFERRPGKTDCFNSNHSADLRESYLSFSEHNNTKNDLRVLSCFNKNLNHKAVTPPEPLKSFSNLTELIVWSSANGIATKQTHFDITRSPSIDQKKLNIILSSVHKWLNFPLKHVPHENFKHPAQPNKILILLNSAKEPEKKGIERQGLQRLSNKSDALCYGATQDNLIFSVDLISVNSWNEIETRQFLGPQCLLETIIEYLQMSLPGTHQALPKITIQCVSAQHNITTARRVNQWFLHISNCFYKNHPLSTRYIFQLSKKIYCLQFRNMNPVIDSFNSSDSLLEHLNLEQNKYSPIVFDPEALKNHPLRIMAQHASSKAISIFYRVFNLGLEIFIFDEMGSVTHTMYRKRKDHNPLKPLHKFLRSVLHRQSLMLNPINNKNNNASISIKFFQLIALNSQQYTAKERHISTDITFAPGFDVKATAWSHNTHSYATTKTPEAFQNKQEMNYDFSCDGERFSSRDHGQDIFNVTAKHILSLRQTVEFYPIYISDLDLSLYTEISTTPNRIHTSHYLQVKSVLEYQLNRALKIANKS